MMSKKHDEITERAKFLVENFSDKDGNQQPCINMETFKDIAGYEGIYMVSNFGRVRSLERTVKAGSGARIVPEILLKYGVDEQNYITVGLCKNGKQRTRRVHRLVAAAFIGPRPKGYHCCHNDGDPANNAASNLRYDTPAGNNADKIHHDTHQRGERHGGSKLTEAQVLAIRADTRSQRIIAADYGISQQNVYLIRHRKGWAWL